MFDPLNTEPQPLPALPHHRTWPKSTTERQWEEEGGPRTEEPMRTVHEIRAIYSVEGEMRQSSLKGESE